MTETTKERSPWGTEYEVERAVSRTSRLAGSDSVELPKINIKCEITYGGITGTTDLRVIRVEREDDGSLTAVTDHWPND